MIAPAAKEMETPRIPLAIFRQTFLFESERGRMNAIWLAALILGSGFAIFGAQTAKWKLTNLAIILVCMAAGFGIGYAAGLGSKNLGQVYSTDVPLSMMFGIVAAFGCIQSKNLSQAPAIGLEAGRNAPTFALQDQLGHQQTNESLKGTNGTVLLFVRSADW